MDVSSLGSIWLASYTIPPSGCLQLPVAAKALTRKSIVKTQEAFLLTTES